VKSILVPDRANFVDLWPAPAKQQERVVGFLREAEFRAIDLCEQNLARDVCPVRNIELFKERGTLP
jgi:hypothetical protein